MALIIVISRNSKELKEKFKNREHPGTKRLLNEDENAVNSSDKTRSVIGRIFWREHFPRYGK